MFRKEKKVKLINKLKSWCFKKSINKPLAQLVEKKKWEKVQVYKVRNSKKQTKLKTSLENTLNSVQ